MSSTFSVFLGRDVGKDNHHAVGLDPDGKRLHDAPLPNTEPRAPTPPEPDTPLAWSEMPCWPTSTPNAVMTAATWKSLWVSTPTTTC